MKNAVLKFIARKIMKTYKPFVIGITGSVGKTSTKEAVYAVVKQKFRAYRSPRNLNTESGLPISTLALDDIPFGKWMWRLAVMRRAVKLLFCKVTDYPEVLVLEYGADKPGDIEYLVSIIKPDIAVLTAVAPTHLEQFGSVDAVRTEKMKLLQSVTDRTKRIYNADLVSRCDGVSYGIQESADIRAIESHPAIGASPNGVSMRFKIQFEGSTVPCELNGVLGNAYVSCALAAVAVGHALGMNVIDCVKGLASFHGKPGHMRALPGVRGTTIIDDTYNSSPVAVKHAVDTVARLDGFARRWIVLGDMLELGADAVNYHREVGECVARSGIERLVTVRTLAKEIASGARQAGMFSGFIFEFDDTVSAGAFLQEHIENGDIVLVKGSQGVKMEVIVKAIMAEPERADELLVRRSFGV